MKLSNKHIFESIVGEIDKRTQAYLETMKLAFSTYYKIERNIIVRYDIRFYDYHHSFITPKKVKNVDIDKLNKYSDTFNFSPNFIKVGFESHGEYKVIYGNIYQNLLDKKDIYLSYEEAETALIDNLRDLEMKVAFIRKNKVPADYDFPANGYKCLGIGNLGAKETAEYKMCSKLKHTYMQLSAENQYIVYCPCCKIYYGAFSDD